MVYFNDLFMIIDVFDINIFIFSNLIFIYYFERKKKFKLYILESKVYLLINGVVCLIVKFVCFINDCDKDFSVKVVFIVKVFK